MQTVRLADREATLDRVGACLLGAAVVWTVATAAIAGGRPGPVVLILVATGAAFAAGRVVGVAEPRFVPAAIGGICVLLAAIYLRQNIAGKALGGPLQYSNASAALYLQGTIAALVLATVRPGPGRVAGLIGAAILGCATLVADSRATDALLLLPVVALFLRRPADVRSGLMTFAGLLVAALLLTVTLGATAPAGVRHDRGLDSVDTALSGNRLALWHDAMTLIGEHPVSGVGPGRFQFESPTARSDRDLRWAHNGFLQQGAEQGLVGLFLTLALFLWVFVRLGVSPTADRTCALAGAAVGALGIQACVDYLLHFPALPIAAAALAGSVISSSSPRWFPEVASA